MGARTVFFGVDGGTASKRRDRAYRAGQSTSWIKIKNRRRLRWCELRTVHGNSERSNSPLGRRREIIKRVLTNWQHDPSRHNDVRKPVQSICRAGPQKYLTARPVLYSADPPHRSSQLFDILTACRKPLQLATVMRGAEGDQRQSPTL
jgi:hypothetical protein